mmetsp:Transcript_56270/g.182657  ORF Transcript_56270/g.182657 Transcript_56270/m.182657 type:complete len:455 (+) Transcript_56270:1095-2459(+)
MRLVPRSHAAWGREGTEVLSGGQVSRWVPSLCSICLVSLWLRLALSAHCRLRALLRKLRLLVMPVVRHRRGLGEHEYFERRPGGASRGRRGAAGPGAEQRRRGAHLQAGLEVCRGLGGAAGGRLDGCPRRGSRHAHRGRQPRHVRRWPASGLRAVTGLGFGGVDVPRSGFAESRQLRALRARRRLLAPGRGRRGARRQWVGARDVRGDAAGSGWYTGAAAGAADAAAIARCVRQGCRPRPRRRPLGAPRRRACLARAAAAAHATARGAAGGDADAGLPNEEGHPGGQHHAGTAVLDGRRRPQYQERERRYSPAHCDRAPLHTQNGPHALGGRVPLGCWPHVGRAPEPGGEVRSDRDHRAAAGRQVRAKIHQLGRAASAFAPPHDADGHLAQHQLSTGCPGAGAPGDGARELGAAGATAAGLPHRAADFRAAGHCRQRGPLPGRARAAAGRALRC